MKRDVVALVLACTSLFGVTGQSQTVLTDCCVTNGAVYAIAVEGGTVYIGGDFTWVGSQSGTNGAPRTHIAALDATTGHLKDWNPGADGIVHAIAVSGNTVYAGGDFTHIGGQGRNRIASLDAVTGRATSWNPGASGSVFCIVVNGSTVYIGGLFGNAGGQNRSNIAALSTTSNSALSWNPGADQTIRCLLLSDNTLYAGGQFTYIGGRSRSCIAALSTSSNSATTWNPGADSYVYGLAISGSTLYVGGNFTYLGGSTRSHIGALNVLSNVATNWNPGATDAIRSLDLNGSILYCGGQFHGLGGKTRNFLGSLDIVTGQTTGWNPDLGGIVRTLSASGSSVYAGGDFRSAGGIGRNYVVALHDDTPAVQLVMFRGTVQQKGGVRLEWTTLSEVNNRGFEVERRDPGRSLFVPLPGAFLSGYGTTSAAHSYAYVDSETVAGELAYRLKQIDLDGKMNYSDTIEVAVTTSVGEQATPIKIALDQNYPNPFNPMTTIRYGVSHQTHLKMTVFNTLGQQVALLVNGDVDAGYHEVRFDGSALASGLYFYSLLAGNFRQTRSLCIVK